MISTISTNSNMKTNNFNLTDFLSHYEGNEEKTAAVTLMLFDASHIKNLEIRKKFIRDYFMRHKYDRETCDLLAEQFSVELLKLKPKTTH